MATLNATHDPARKSWVESANAADCDFPIQNLPLGVFRKGGGKAQGGIAIGDQILDLAAALKAGLFSGAAAEAAQAAAGETLNSLMALGNEHASALRARVSDLLRADSADKRKVETLLVPMSAVQMVLPAKIGSFTDYLCSVDHTKRMSQTGDMPPAFKSLPIAYHSRASSVRISGEPVRRPNGQFRTHDGKVQFGPEPSQDYELEIGCFIGPGNALGAPISMREAPKHIFGFCLLNDWSARGIQRFESTPLGPFLSKSLSTTISPWIVTAEAMAPFRAPAYPRDPADEPFPHLSSPENKAEGNLDLALEAFIVSPKMKTSGAKPAAVTRTSGLNTYWTFAQMLVHHASNGCNMAPGDLLGSGTMSGPSEESQACLAEKNKRGTEKFDIGGGEMRTWIEDGDEVIFRARAARAGSVSIGFGECRGRLEPAVPWPS
jgi:fumarylacetoacetase